MDIKTTKKITTEISRYSLSSMKICVWIKGRLSKTCTWLAVLLLFIGTPSFAQWMILGPGPTTDGQVENMTDNPVVGAIHALAPHPTNADILYIGAVNGGIWKTVNATAANPAWICQTNDQVSPSIGALVFDPADATNQTLVAGIGRFSSMGRRGGERTGLLRTVDGGANWISIDGGGTLTGLNISGLAVQGNTIVISVNIANSFADHGIWRSTDTGASWTQISDGAGTGLPAGEAYDLAMDPTDPTRLFTNAASNGIYRSEDQGATWTKVSDAAMDAVIMGTSNIEISVGMNDNVFVAIVSGIERLDGLFRSDDDGDNWTPLDLPETTEDGGVSFGIHPGLQGNIHLSIVADPTNSDIVYIGGDRQPYHTEATGWGWPGWPNSIGANDYSGRLFRVDASQPAGNQASHITHDHTSSNSAPHADSRDMAFSANGDLIEVDDGGVYRRTGPQTDTGDWFSLNGDLRATEFHDIAWDAVAKVVIGGTQDTGTPEQIFPANVRWRTVSKGDGGDVAVDDTGTPGLSTRYSSYYNLSDFRRCVYNSANVLQSEVNPALTVISGTDPGYQFYTPIQLNNVDPDRLIIGAWNSVYESLDQGDNITELNPAGITVNSSGRDPIAYGAAGNPDMLYVGDGSQVFIRDAAHPAPLTASAAYTGGTVVDIAIDPADPLTAWVIDDDNVFQTTDAGVTWTDITGDLQTHDPGDFKSLAYSTSNADGSVIVGGNNGVFIASGPAFTTWVELGADLPTALIYDMEYDPTDEILLAGSLGRGAWLFNLAERDPVDVVLVLDISGSMQSAACSTCEAKLDVLKDAVEIFINLWTTLAIPDDRLGIVYFRTDITDFDVSGTVLLPVLANAQDMIDNVRAQTTDWNQLTAMGGGIQYAINEMTDATRPRNIILFTDGMQNVNPKVLQIDDSPPPDASHLEIDHDPADTDFSNVDPTIPPTQLDDDLDIKVNTIGVGTSAFYADLLDNIALKTNGLTKLTEAPDEDLRRFYVEELIDALRSFSPQLLAYRYGFLSDTTQIESFTTNNGAKKIVFKLSWNREKSLDMRIKKDGIDLTPYGQIIGGDFYRIFSIEVPTEINGMKISSGGNWNMVISGQSGTYYQVAVIVDEPLLEYDFCIGKNEYFAGQPVNLKVSLTYGKMPVNNAKRVAVTVLKPKQGLGTLLSTAGTPPQTSVLTTEPGATAGQKKWQLLTQDREFYKELQPLQETVILQNNGDGSYSANFNNTNLTGIYTFIFQVYGSRSDIGSYQRTEIRSATVRFAKAERKRSDLKVSLINETADGRNMQLYIRPKDQFNNYLGPDYGHHIRVSLSPGTVGKDIHDPADGSYTIPLYVPPETDPMVNVTVMSKTIFNDRLSKLEKGTGTYWALSAHAGRTLPIGDFDKSFNPGLLTEIDVEYRFLMEWSLEAVLGRYTFDPDFEIVGGTLYLKKYFQINQWQPYGCLGGGIYNPENADAAFSLNAGAGLYKPIKPNLGADIGIYYFHVFPDGDDIDFIGLKTGLRYIF